MNKTVIHKIRLWSAFLTVFLLPLNPKLSTVPSILFILCSIPFISKSSLEKWKSFPAWGRLAVLSIPAFFLYHVLGMLWTADSAEGWLDISRKLNLFFIPLSIAILPFSRKTLSQVFKVFLLGISLSLIINYWRIGFEYLESRNMEMIIGGSATGIVHLGYYSIYLVCGLAFILSYLREAGDIKPWKKIGLLVISISAIGILILSGSKMGLITLVIVIGLKALFSLNSKDWKRSLALSLGLIAAMAIGTYSNDYMKDRMKSMVVELNKSELDTQSFESSMVRRMTWGGAIALWKKDILFGTGTGDIQNDLMEVYHEMGYVAPYSKNMDPHSQYLQSAACLGIGGLLLLLLSLILPVFYGLKRGEFLLVAVSLTLLLANVSEGFLERQAGIQFFSFFLPALILASLSKENYDMV